MAEKHLVIVESPAKAKTINKFLGANFIVRSSVGHIRDLPTSSSKVSNKKTANKTSDDKAPDKKATKLSAQEKAKLKLFDNMGINPEKNWEAHYTILPGKEKVIKELKELAKNSKSVYLATDLDREGEAIAWHLQEILKKEQSHFSRVIFNEITKNAIQKAFEQPSKINMDRVNAQQTRRFLDRVVGYMLSPLLWEKISRGLSAGRVQSVAVKLIVEREEAIQRFIPEEYWQLFANLLTAKQDAVLFEVIKYQNDKFNPKNEAETERAIKELENASYLVKEREDKPIQKSPNPPFITSTLQQAASTRFGFGVKKTMTLAQKLYENGYITYMRTDSTNLSADSVTAAREYIEQHFGTAYLPAKPAIYASKATAQEAHEAIRPTHVDWTENQITTMTDPDAKKLYDLIRRQFIACQAAPARYISTNILVSAGDYELKAHGKIVAFDGFTKILPPVGKNEDLILPAIQTGEVLKLDKLLPKQNFTKPPARYNEASLVKELEKKGIGRPSTYASIISTIQDRGYVSLKKRRFYAEKIGEIVTHRLEQNFNDLMNYDFTASMEKELDKIAEGHFDWKELLNQFYKTFTEKLEQARKHMKSSTTISTDIPCNTCGKPMLIRNGSTGIFLGCEGYSLPKEERCTHTVNLVSEEQILTQINLSANIASHKQSNDSYSEESETTLLRNKKRCPVCQTTMQTYLMDAQHKIHICSRQPDCPDPACPKYELEQGNFGSNTPTENQAEKTLECDKCQAGMTLKTGRFGPFFACNSCGNTRKVLANGQAAQPKMTPISMAHLKCSKVDDHYILRDGASGLFLAASKFPKNRETRSPLLSEIFPYKNQLPEKYHFLFSGPLQDDQGHPTEIRFSRKSGEHYLMTVKDNRPTGWRAEYLNNQWNIKKSGKNKDYSEKKII